MPENLENMWTKGRNYKKNVQKSVAAPVMKDDKAILQISTKLCTQTLSDGNNNLVHLSHGLNKHQSIGGAPLVDELKGTASPVTCGNKGCLKRSNSTSALNVQPNVEKAVTSGEVGGPIISEFFTPDIGRRSEVYPVNGASDMVLHSEGIHSHKLGCQVIGAYFEKLGSKSFAVYSIAVRDSDKNTWSADTGILRDYIVTLRTFLIIHYICPPKRIFSSSTEDAFVHQRCIQLDKYLQDLLSIANVAEKHEVWDFLSASSKNYSFEKSSSVMRTLAVNVDDAVDDIVRQFKGVSDGLMRKVVGSSSFHEDSFTIPSRNLSWNSDEISNHLSWRSTTESAKSGSDIEEGDKDGPCGHEEVGCSVQASGWHSDNELNSKGFPPKVIKRSEKFRSSGYGKKHGSEADPLLVSLGEYPPAGARVHLPVILAVAPVPLVMVEIVMVVPLVLVVDEVVDVLLATVVVVVVAHRSVLIVTTANHVTLPAEEGPSSAPAPAP
ncbi:phox domain-containing protein [Actinidia rufa]|uniref:Phox domain-containing protein n=1 Tax=Actinidia rufa TaxID=165716 RepID=A0A7J0F8M6_9ERIC|nr:phox domain-containing protein [Actinidia rufa]